MEITTRDFNETDTVRRIGKGKTTLVINGCAVLVGYKRFIDQQANYANLIVNSGIAHGDPLSYNTAQFLEPEIKLSIGYNV